MPTLRLPVLGSRVITQGRVMNRPPSFGQHCRMGKSSSEKLSRLMTSLQGPVGTVLGKNLPISASMGSIFTLSRKPCGDLTSMKARMRSAISSRDVDFEGETHAAGGAELVDQKLLAGITFEIFKEERFAAGLRSFGPLDSEGGCPRAGDFDTRSVISVISRIGSASVRMRFSSPARSSALIQSRRSS